MSSATAFTFEALPQAFDDFNITLPAAAPQVTVTSFVLPPPLTYVAVFGYIHVNVKSPCMLVVSAVKVTFWLAHARPGVMDAAATGAPFTGIHRVALLPHAL